MKYAIILAAFALVGCKSSNDGPVLTTAAQYAYPAEPAEGVYPDCKYGVVAPEYGAACAVPTNRD